MYNYYYQEQNFEDRRQAKYALVAYLPLELDKIVAPLREKYDPLYDQIASHVTIVFPFETDRPLEDIVGIIGREISIEMEIKLELGSITDFYPATPVICWEVKKNEQLTSLYFRLYSRLGLTLPLKDYQPHVTIAREISHHRVLLVKEKIVPYLPLERFVISSLDLITPLAESKWVSVRTFPLLKIDTD